MMQPIWLPPDLVKKCKDTSIARDAIKDPATNRANRRDKPGWMLNYEGLRLECAAAKYLRCPEAVSFTVQKFGDGGTDLKVKGLRIQAKASNYDPPWIRFDIYGSQSLDADLIIVGKTTEDDCLMELHGWVTRKRFLRDAKVENLGYGDRLVMKPPYREMAELWAKLSVW